MENKYFQRDNPKRQKLIQPLQPLPDDSLERSAKRPDLDVRTRIRTVKALQEHLLDALQLELSTVPPYLCGLYTIKAGTNIDASKLIRSVVVEEMLHMILVANILNAVTKKDQIKKGEKIIKDIKSFIPAYPTKVLPGNIVPAVDPGQPPFEVHLRKFSKEAIDTFCDIEKPAKTGLKINKKDGYDSIGQFYLAIRYGLLYLKDQITTKDGTFIGDPARQVKPEHYYGSGGKIIPVIHFEDAEKAIEEIVGQGEGVDGTIMDPDYNMFGEEIEYAHYFKFQEINYGRLYSPNDTNYKTPANSIPTGAPLDISWSSVHNMKLDPKMKDYGLHPQLKQLNHDFNSIYVKLIRNINDAISGDPDKLIEGITLMYDLKYKAEALMNIQLGNGECAGPTFEYVE